MVLTEDHLFQDQDLFPGTQNMVDLEDSLSMTDHKEMERMIRIMIQELHKLLFLDVCHCGTCNQIKTDCQEIKKMLEKLEMKRVHEVSAEEFSATAINLCSQELAVAEEMMINFTYTDSGRKLMILDIGAPVSLAGISWMEQYLQEFGLTIEQMNSVECN